MIWFLLIFLTSLEATAFNKNVCEGFDDRQMSFDDKIARVRNDFQTNTSCTATLIGTKCMISAGHCLGYLKYAEFKVPLSDENGKAQKPDEENIFEIDQNSIQSIPHYIGRDWSVFKTLPNKLTGKYPGEIWGYYELDYDQPLRTAEVRITGYGSTSIKNLNYVQKTDFGPVVSLEESIIKYVVDTTGGNSGSAIIDNSTRKIIGVHTNGGCTPYYGSNYGTIISGNLKFQEAIQECLKSN